MTGYYGKQTCYFFGPNKDNICLHFTQQSTQQHVWTQLRDLPLPLTKSLLLNISLFFNIADQCPPGWVYFENSSTCFEAFSGPLTHEDAQKFCSAQGGNLATVSNDELDFVIKLNWKVNSSYWMGYTIERANNASSWELHVASNIPVGRLRSQWFANSNIPRPSEVPPNKNKLCVALEVQRGNYFYLWHWEVNSCDTPGAFLCVRGKFSPLACWYPLYPPINLLNKFSTIYINR